MNDTVYQDKVKAESRHRLLPAGNKKGGGGSLRPLPFAVESLDLFLIGVRSLAEF